MCTHTRKAETKNNSRIMQSSSFILERSFLLEYFRKQNKCDLFATWFDMQHLLLGSVQWRNRRRLGLGQLLRAPKSVGPLRNFQRTGFLQ